MQDITPLRRRPQDTMRTVRPAARPNALRERPVASRGTYTRSTRIISDVVVGNTLTETMIDEIEVVTESMTLAPAARAQPVEPLSSVVASQAMERALSSAKHALKVEHHKRRNLQRWVLVGLISTVILVTGLIIVTTVFGLD